MKKMKNTLNIYLTLFFTIISCKVVFCEISVSLCSPFKPALVPYPGDCTKFIKCSYGQSTIFSCKTGTIFNPKLNQCISSQLTNHCQDITNGSQNLQVFCPRYSNDRFPHPFNCKKFVACNYGMTYIMDCALGTVYNPLTGDCDWPRNVPGCSKNFGNGIKLRNDVAFFSENLRNGRSDFRFKTLIDNEKKHQTVIKNNQEHNANRTHQGNGLGHQVNNQHHPDSIQSINNIKDKHPYKSKNSLEDLSQTKHDKQNQSSTNKSTSKNQLRPTSSGHYTPKKLDHDQTKKQLNHSTQNENNNRNQISNQTTNKIGNSLSTQTSSYTQTTVLYDERKNRAGSPIQPKYINQNQQLNNLNNSSINVRSRYNLTKNQSSTPAQTRYDKHNQKYKQGFHTDSHLHPTSMHNYIETTTMPYNQLESQSTSFSQTKHNHQEQSTGHQINTTSQLPLSSVNVYTKTTVPHDQLKNQEHIFEEKNQSNFSSVSDRIDITSHVPSVQGTNHIRTKTHDQLEHREISTTETEHYYQNHSPGRQSNVINHSLSTLEVTYEQTTALPDRLINLPQTEHSNQNQSYGKRTEATSIMPLIDTDNDIQTTTFYNLTETPIDFVTEKKIIDRDDLTDYKINEIDSFVKIPEGDYTQMPDFYDRQIRQDNDVTQNKYVNKSKPLNDQGINGVKNRSTSQNNFTTFAPATLTDNYDQTTIHYDDITTTMRNHQLDNQLDTRMRSEDENISLSHQSDVTTFAPTTLTDNLYQTTIYFNQPNNQLKTHDQFENKESLINQLKFDHYNQSLKDSTHLDVDISLNGSANHVENLPNDLPGQFDISNDTNSVDQHLSVVNSTYPSSYSSLNRGDYYSYRTVLDDQSKDQSTPVNTTDYDNLSKCSHTDENVIIRIDLLDNSIEKILSCKDNNITSIPEKPENDTKTEHQEIDTNDPLFNSPMTFDGQNIDSLKNRSNKSLESINEISSDNTIVKNSSPDDFYYYYNTEDHLNNTVQIDENYSKIRYQANYFIVNGNSENNESNQTFEELNHKSSSIKKVFSENTENTSMSNLFITPFKSTNEEQDGVIDQLSGQTFRLRGGSDTHYGYVEIQGIGLVGLCDNSWDLKKASKVCKKLGHKRGAEISWKGQTNDKELSLPLLENNIICQDNTAKFQTCTFAKSAECSIERDTVGVKCLIDSSAHCNQNEVPFNQNCYHLVNSSLDLNHEDAINYCSSVSSSLLYITSQDENDFISEWLTQKHPQVESIMTAGIGFPILGNTVWVWQDSGKSLFNFTKWWPGWKNEKKLLSPVKSKISCIVMKNKFPCHNQPNLSCETDGYFFWDVEDCATSMKGSHYICKRPYNNKQSYNNKRRYDIIY